MGALTPEFLFDFESRMQAITENEYARLASRMWWSRFMKTRPSGSKKELVSWLLSTAKIEDLGKFGGRISFEDMISQTTTFENRSAGAGLKLRRFQLEDLDGGGMDLAAKWSGDIGSYMAYWPQKQLATLIKNGELAANTAYDGVSFFSKSHLVNGVNSDQGTFANLFSGAAASTPSTDPNDAGYPGACPIDPTNATTVETATNNLAKAIAYIKSIKMPNGEDPRFLNPVALVVPPALQARAVQITNAKFLAQAAGSGGGSGDVAAVIQSFGFSQPVVADELAGNDTEFYIACEEAGASQLGAFVYVDREPFKITYYTGQGGGTGVDAILNRADELEWHCKGRNVAGYGHPYLFFKLKAT